MTSTRREFLKFGAAGLSFVSLGALSPRLLIQAAEESTAADKNDHVLVAVELSGGNDGLNTLVPFANDLYYKNRPRLGIPKAELRTLNERVGLHPALESLAAMFKEGHVAIVQGVGYPEPDRSHFRSMEIWHTASIDKKPPSTGWLGRLVDTVPSSSQKALPGLAFTGALPQALLADRNVVPVVGELEAFAGAETDQPDVRLRRKLSTSGGASAGPVGFLRKQSAAVFQTVDQLREATAKYKSTIEYPGSQLGQQLRRSAQVIAGNLGTRVLYVSQDGYDTHSAQADQHGALLGDLAASLAAFFKDLEGLGWSDRVAALVFSEFGRRVDENGSAGTDHGAASCSFLLGKAVKGGLYGEHPPLDRLGEGDLIFTTDFRQVYSSLLNDWMGCPAQKVLGQEFAGLELFSRRA